MTTFGIAVATLGLSMLALFTEPLTAGRLLFLAVIWTIIGMIESVVGNLIDERRSRSSASKD